MSKNNNSLLQQWNTTSPKKQETTKLARDQIISLDAQTKVHVTRQVNQKQSNIELYSNSPTKTSPAPPVTSYPCFRGVRQTHPSDPEEDDFYLLDGTYEIIQYHDPDFELID